MPKAEKSGFKILIIVLISRIYNDEAISEFKIFQQVVIQVQTSKITDGDLAYLHGLYNTPSGYSLTAQQNEMRYQMKKTLVTDKGGPD